MVDLGNWLDGKYCVPQKNDQFFSEQSDPLVHEGLSDSDREDELN